MDFYRETATKVGKDPATLPVGISSHGFIAEDSQQAAEIFFPSYELMMNRIGRERGWGRITRQQFDDQLGLVSGTVFGRIAGKGAGAAALAASARAA